MFSFCFEQNSFMNRFQKTQYHIVAFFTPQDLLGGHFQGAMVLERKKKRFISRFQQTLYNFVGFFTTRKLLVYIFNFGRHMGVGVMGVNGLEYGKAPQLTPICAHSRPIWDPNLKMYSKKVLGGKKSYNMVLSFLKSVHKRILFETKTEFFFQAYSYKLDLIRKNRTKKCSVFVSNRICLRTDIKKLSTILQLFFTPQDLLGVHFQIWVPYGS